MFCFFASAFAVTQTYRTTPVPILKQINRHNDDGSYSYGYEAADGTFKIETKYPSGEVFGKYGYVGDDGKVRSVEYGASKRGFEPVGSDINVAPPTLTNSVENTNPDYDDGQYREDPSIYYKQTSEPQNTFTGKGLKISFQTLQSQNYQPKSYQTKVFQPQVYQPPLETLLQRQHYNTQPYYRPARLVYDPAIFNGHPATNVDLNTGSYTISYSG